MRWRGESSTAPDQIQIREIESESKIGKLFCRDHAPCCRTKLQTIHTDKENMLVKNSDSGYSPLAAIDMMAQLFKITFAHIISQSKVLQNDTFKGIEPSCDLHLNTTPFKSFSQKV